MKKIVCIAMALCMILCGSYGACAEDEVNIFDFLYRYEFFMETGWNLEPSAPITYFSVSVGEHAMYQSKDMLVQFSVKDGSKLGVMSITINSGDNLNERLICAMLSIAYLKNPYMFIGMNETTFTLMCKGLLEGAYGSSLENGYYFSGATVAKTIGSDGEISYFIVVE